ncbi:UNVERIFIED_CONTAM: putative intracellular protease/amidase [Paenibacillus sp. PvR008]
MSKKALFIIPPERFNEDELFKPKEALEQAGVTVTLASTQTGEITGDYNGKATANLVITDAVPADYDVVAVIGGSGTNDHLWNNADLQALLKQAHEQTKISNKPAASSPFFLKGPGAAFLCRFCAAVSK